MSDRATALLRRVVDVRAEEIRTVLWAAVYSFFLLASFYLLRPLREEMGVAGGIKNLPWMFTGTWVATLLFSPFFGYLVSRYARRRFIPYAYRFFLGNLLVFFVLFRVTEGAAHLGVARALYIWVSVYNLFVVAVFWGYMADIFTSEQGKRLFGFIGVGGTLGAIAGSGFTTSAVKSIGATALLLVAAVMVEASLFAFRRIDRVAPTAPTPIAA
ncbi:MAG TPA: MFS transporter, partial [Candidatus Polarisedimenticolia bacterium]|nr:MFS transporter [Candidatus Polarisedimenticolia bacterium]